MAHLYNGILFSHKNPRNNAICSNMGGPGDGVSQTDQDTIRYHLHVKYTKTTYLQNKTKKAHKENKLMVAKEEVGGEG